MTTSEGELNAAIAELWVRSRGEMMRRVGVVERALAALSEDRLGEELRAEAQREAHKIAGSAGTFGFAAASEAARAVELALRDGAGTDAAPRLSELAAAMRRELEGDGTAEDAARPTPAATADVLVVCGGALAAEPLEAELTARGLSVAVAHGDAAQALGPAVAVVDLGDAAAGDWLERLPAEPAVALIGLAADVRLEARVAFVRRGGRVLMPADAAPGEIADAIEALRARSGETATRVLVVDDDPGLLELTTTILRRRGLEPHGLDDPARFWRALETVHPDALLLDLDMPGFNGLELCRTVRADPRWTQLPVLFLTARTDPESVRAVFEAGADDYLTKPVVEEELVQRIRNRLERVRLLREMADRDALTGVASRRKASDELARLERLARRHGQPLTLALLDLDRFKAVNDSFGHETGDEVLRRLGRRLLEEFRGEDVVGRWGGEEFVIAMYAMPIAVAVERLERLLESWRGETFREPAGGEFHTDFTAGVAELPAGAATLADLLRAADDALYRAKAAGRSRVWAAGAHADDVTGLVDVVVIEDDSTLAELLEHALSAEGWSTRVLADGSAAVGVLASEPPLLRARLALLDWDLPGLDGLEVLRRLRGRGALAGTHVMMLTARGSEGDVLEALELGAADHVTKPFSVPVLLEKVRRILERA